MNERLQLERRTVVALESIAISLRIITGEEEKSMVAKKPETMIQTPAEPPKAKVEEVEPDLGILPDQDDDEVEPMNDKD